MNTAKKRTRAEEELAAAEQRRLAPVLREAHARLGLWRTSDDKTCRRSGSCGGEVDQCGARVAPEGWAWLHQVLKGDAGREIAERGGRGRQPRRARLSAASDPRMAALPVLGADRVRAASRRQLDGRPYGARAAEYRPAIHRVGRVALAPHRAQRRHEDLRHRDAALRCVGLFDIVRLESASGPAT